MDIYLALAEQQELPDGVAGRLSWLTTSWRTAVARFGPHLLPGDYAEWPRTSAKAVQRSMICDRRQA